MIKTRIVCTTHDLDKTFLISIRKNPTFSVRRTLLAALEWRSATHRPLTLDEASAKLKEDAATVSVGERDAAALRTDTVRVPSVTPCEDDLSYGKIDVGGEREWSFWGIYDGHSLVHPTNPPASRSSYSTKPGSLVSLLGAGLLPQSCASPSKTT